MRLVSACCGGFGGSFGSRSRLGSISRRRSRTTIPARCGGCSRPRPSPTRSSATSRTSSAPGSARRLVRGPEPDGEPPGAVRLEQRVRVDLVGPADEVALGLVVRRAVNRAPLPRPFPLQVVAALERRLALLARRSFEVTPGHALSLHLTSWPLLSPPSDWPSATGGWRPSTASISK